MATQLVHPLSATLALLLLALLALAWRRRGAAMGCLLIAFIGTWLLATPVVADALLGSLEQRTSPTRIDRLPQSDAIVVLGGGVSPQAAPRKGPNLGRAADRLWYGAKLYRADKAPRVIVTGQRPYADAGPSAADAAAEVLQTLEVPESAILAPGRSSRTATDARIVRELVDQNDFGRLLLVTSAAHMPRALATFHEAGVNVFPAPTDFEVTRVARRGEYGWLPDQQAFERSSLAVHEYIGLLWYRLQGWM